MSDIHVCVTRRLIVWALLIVGVTSSPANAQSAGSRFLVISDFHFDPFDGLNREQFQKLAKAPIEDWPNILATQPPAAYGRDAPYALVECSLNDARQRLADPDFILCPGDFLAHNWQDKYDRLAEKPRAEDIRAYRNFTSNVVRFLAGRIGRAFPKAPFYPVVGNDDSYCGDYMIAPESDFLSTFAEIWEPLLRTDAKSEDGVRFQAAFAPGGHYTIRLSHLKRHRLIALNSVFFATQYENACGSSTATPALDQFRWLETTLDAAEKERETVWLLMHIPAGVDSYRTAQARGFAKGFWQPELTARFLQLVKRFSSTIQFAVAGHTHMDDFRLIRLEEKPILLTKIVPAISPIFGNNPGYQVFDYERETGTVENYRTYYLPLSQPGVPAAPEESAVLKWRTEYDFRETYGLFPLNTASVEQLTREIAKGGSLQAPYLKNYSVSGPRTSVGISILNCTIGNVTVSDCNACLNATNSAAN